MGRWRLATGVQTWNGGSKEVWSSKRAAGVVMRKQGDIEFGRLDVGVAPGR